MRYADCSFCDDIRYEQGFKTSLMGIYGSHLLVNPIPSVIPKLCVAVFCSSPVDRPFKTVSARIYFGEKLLAEQILPPSEIELMHQSMPADVLGEPIEQLQVGFNMTLMPLVIEQAGILKVFVLADGETLLAGKLRINTPEAHEKTNSN